MNITIRAETAKDYLKITEINDLAFKQPNEGKLVEKLRQTGKFIPELSLVAEYEHEIIGHILFYPILIRSNNETFDSLALVPVSVLPQYQRQGIGSQLVRAGLECAKQLGHTSVIVLGHPDYYPKFGFRPASIRSIKAPFDVPDDVFLALPLTEGALDKVSGIVEYPQEFDDV